MNSLKQINLKEWFYNNAWKITTFYLLCCLAFFQLNFNWFAEEQAKGLTSAKCREILYKENPYYNNTTIIIQTNDSIIDIPEDILTPKGE